MLPATDLTTLNHRLAALNLPAQTAASLAALPALMSQDRIEHALRKAEGGDQGAWRFLSKHLPASRPAPTSVPSAPSTAPRPAATLNADTAPAPRPSVPRRRSARSTRRAASSGDRTTPAPLTSHATPAPPRRVQRRRRTES